MSRKIYRTEALEYRRNMALRHEVPMPKRTPFGRIIFVAILLTVLAVIALKIMRVSSESLSASQAMNIGLLSTRLSNH